MVDVVDPRELQQHDGVVLVVEKKRLGRPREKSLGQTRLDGGRADLGQQGGAILEQPWGAALGGYVVRLLPPCPPFIALKTDLEVDSYSKWSSSFLRVKVKDRILVQLGLPLYGQFEDELLWDSAS